MSFCLALPAPQTQNLVIARQLGWDFMRFAQEMAPVTVLAWSAGLCMCVVVEVSEVFGYGAKMPEHVRQVLSEFVHEEYGKIHATEAAELLVQALAMVALVLGLAFHVTEVGFVALAVAIVITICNGVESHDVSMTAGIFPRAPKCLILDSVTRCAGCRSISRGNAFRGAVGGIFWCSSNHPRAEDI